MLEHCNSRLFGMGGSGSGDDGGGAGGGGGGGGGSRRRGSGSRSGSSGASSSCSSSSSNIQAGRQAGRQAVSQSDTSGSQPYSRSTVVNAYMVAAEGLGCRSAQGFNPAYLLEPGFGTIGLGLGDDVGFWG